LRNGILSFDWAIFFYWLMATTSGWLFGWLLLPAIALAAAGVGAGVVQSLVLYRRLPKAWRWILVTAIGWAIGLMIASPLLSSGLNPLSGVIVGASTGTAQWVVLRGHVRWAGWWIALSALAWTMGLSLAPAWGQVELPPIVLSGVIASLPSGFALELLLRNPKPV